MLSGKVKTNMKVVEESWKSLRSWCNWKWDGKGGMKFWDFRKHQCPCCWWRWHEKSQLAMWRTLRLRSARSRERLLLSRAFSSAFVSGCCSISNRAFLRCAAACAIMDTRSPQEEEKIRVEYEEMRPMGNGRWLSCPRAEKDHLLSLQKRTVRLRQTQELSEETSPDSRSASSLWVTASNPGDGVYVRETMQEGRGTG